MAKEATAEVQEDGKYKVTHEDGSTETLTEKQFHEKYDVEPDEQEPEGETPPGAGTTVRTGDGHPVGSQAGDEDPDTASKRNRPRTHDADDAFWGGEEDFGDEYSEAVETELKQIEEGVKAVRAELKSVGKAKPEERDFGALRAAMHDLLHGKSLLRTAHVATVRHDGPERLRPAPTPETNANSGPGEELNPEQNARRVVGR